MATGTIGRRADGGTTRGVAPVSGAARGGPAARAGRRAGRHLARAIGTARAASAGLALAVLLAGCAATRPPPRPAAPAGPLPRVALLPLEDLSGRAEAGLAFGRILFAELVRTGACQVIEAGLVEAAAESLGLRAPGSLAREEVEALGRQLEADYLMLGSLLESGTVRSAGGEVPSVGAALKLLDAASARVVWASVRFRTGEDRETVFGWGRESDRQKLAAELATELLADLRFPSADSAAVMPREGAR